MVLVGRRSPEEWSDGDQVCVSDALDVRLGVPVAAAAAVEQQVLTGLLVRGAGELADRIELVQEPGTAITLGLGQARQLVSHLERLLSAAAGG